MSCDHRRTFLYGLLGMSPANKAKIVIIIIMIIIGIIRITVAAIANKQQQYEDLFLFLLAAVR
jgi:uncharacterized membrane protein